jgi:hypothetical protein
MQPSNFDVLGQTGDSHMVESAGRSTSDVPRFPTSDGVYIHKSLFLSEPCIGLLSAISTASLWPDVVASYHLSLRIQVNRDNNDFL